MKSKIIFSELPLLMIILSIVQICLVLVQVVYGVLVYSNVIISDKLYNGGYIVPLVIAVFLFNLLILRQVWLTLKRGYAMINEQEETIKNINALNNRIRAQRHDFLNHIQVLYGMMEMEAYDEMRAYLHKLYGDIETANSFLKTGVLAVNALLQVKYSHAQALGIPFQIEIGTRLTEAPLTEWDMCKLLGNLIDNAFHATESFDGKKSVQVRLNETLDAILFCVTNNGPPITSEHKARLFDPGFTTRKDQGEGMGLYIVKQIADAHRGTVSAKSQDGLTEFTVTIPKTPVTSLP